MKRGAKHVLTSSCSLSRIVISWWFESSHPDWNPRNLDLILFTDQLHWTHRISLLNINTSVKPLNVTDVAHETGSSVSPAAKHHMTLHKTNVRPSVHTHADNNFTVRHSKRSCLPTELQLLTSREKSIPAEPRRPKVTGPPGWRNLLFFYNFLHD